ncbi:molybdate ABC transporter substrate-binding protein [Cobetia marina]
MSLATRLRAHFRSCQESARLRRTSLTARSTLLMTLVALLAAPVQADEPTRIRVMAAASLHDAMDAIEARYERLANVDILPVYASSSTLARQLANGAPAQLYCRPTSAGWTGLSSSPAWW